MRAIQKLMSIKKQFMIIYLHAMLQFRHPKQQQQKKKTCKTASITKHAFVILCYTCLFQVHASETLGLI